MSPYYIQQALYKEKDTMGKEHIRMNYAEFLPPLLMLIAASGNIAIGVKVVQLTKTQGQPLPWYRQMNIDLGITFLLGGLFSLLIAINSVTHNGVSDTIFLVAMIVLSIPFLASLVILYKAARYHQQQQNQSQVK